MRLGFRKLVSRVNMVPTSQLSAFSVGHLDLDNTFSYF